MTHTDARASKLIRRLAAVQAGITMLSLLALSVPVQVLAQPTPPTPPTPPHAPTPPGLVNFPDFPGDDTHNWPHIPNWGFTGTLHVDKEVVGGTASPDDFGFTVTSWTWSGLNTTAYAFPEDGHFSATVPFGIYWVKEDTATDYTATYEGCSKIVLWPLFNGEWWFKKSNVSRTCTITNTFTGNEEPQEPETCSIVSDTNTLIDGNASVATYTHPAWTGIPGATWIWKTFLVDTGLVPDTTTFTRSFVLSAVPSSATLTIAADNTYTVLVNGVAPTCDGTQLDNFSAADSCAVMNLVNGVNTLTFTVTNTEGSSDPHDNPAGLDYKLDIIGGSCSEVPPPPPQTGTLTVIKEVVGAPNGVTASDFMISVTDGEDQNVANSPHEGVGGNGYSYVLPPGSYTVSEEENPNYVTTFSETCSDGTVDVGANQEIGCVVTNTYVLPAPTNTCVMPSVGEADADYIESFGDSAPELTLQQVLDGAGFSENAVDDQVNYQYWAASGNTVHFTATALAKLSGYTHVFGYYTAGDINTFVPLFRDGTVPGADNALPLKTVSGDGSVAFDITTAGTIGFAIKAFDGALTPVGTYATGNYLNSGQQRDVSYNPNDNEYVMGWDDQATSPDGDYQDLVVDVMVTGCEDAPSCDPEQELLTNGGFENPDVATGDWDLFATGTSGLGWAVNWLDGLIDVTPKLEIQDRVSGWLPFGDSSTQWAELDSDYAKNNTGNPAATTISQDITTVPGQTYTLSFDSSPRPGTAADDNAVEARADGSTIGTVAGVAGGGNTSWTSHSFSFVATNSTTHVELRDAGTPSDSFGAFVDNASLRCTPTNNEPVVTVTASKVVCTDESDLPNWGTGGAPITQSTATAWVNSHENCHLESGWSFQWGNESSADPGRSFIGPADGFTTFGPTNAQGITSVNIPTDEFDGELHLREVLASGYIPFTYDTEHQSNSDDVSAEFYCSNDVLNYDNFDFIRTPQEGSHYYCVAFNVPTRDGGEGEDDGSITIVKHAANGNDTFTFSLSGFDDIDVTTTGGEGSESVKAAPGEYTLTEHSLAGWNFSGATCRDGEEVIGTSDGASETFTLVKGHDITCTFDNWKQTHGQPQTESGSSGGGEVQGDSTSSDEGQVEGETTCTPLLYNFLKQGWKNDPEEVKKLQGFLNDYLHLTIPVTGFFGPQTFNAVKQFQKGEWDKVLKPWFGLPGSGITNENTPTGFVYQTTKWRINNIWCEGSETFPDHLD